ncbi:MAG: hypothetical protein L3J11_02605 [Draconibacterium sp.]|nr:hypothetical protein [Draconibacterium sp.]
MKKILLTFTIILISFFSFSQEVSLSVGPNFGSAFYCQFVAGGASKSPKTGFNSAIEYISKNNKKISWGVGVGFQNNRVSIKPAFWGQPEEERIAHNEKSNILFFNFKMVFRKRDASYLSLDPLIGIQLNESSRNSIDNQTGIGLSFSYVKKIDLNESVFLKIEPKLSVYNIVPFVGNSWQERLTSIGLNIGVGFKNTK